MHSPPRITIRLALAALFVASASTASASRLGLSAPIAPDSAVVLELPASHVALELDLQIEADSWIERFDGLVSAQKIIADATALEGLRVQASRPVTTRPEYGKVSLISSASSRENSFVPGSALQLLAPLAPDNDPTAVVRRLRLFVEKIKLPKNARLTSQSIVLALENPETHREAVLKKIAAHLRASATALGNDPADVSVKQIDGPLRVCQLDAGTVGLFLPFEADYGRD